jgi:hypothetical protein
MLFVSVFEPITDVGTNHTGLANATQRPGNRKTHFALDSGWAGEVREFGEEAVDRCAATDGLDAGHQ